MQGAERGWSQIASGILDKLLAWVAVGNDLIKAKFVGFAGLPASFTFNPSVRQFGQACSVPRGR